jgi:5-methyltetrahydrofolate--homocysteine methyltransferase
MTEIHSALGRLKESLIAGDHIATAGQTTALVEQGIDPTMILNEALLPGMQLIGQRFRNGEYFLPDVLVRARAMKSAMAVLEPLLEKGEYKARGTIVIGTVKGDVHDIGKNLVGVMLRGAGYRVVDIGVGCSDRTFLEAVRTHHPDILGMSALLTTTMTYMKTVISTLRAAGETLPIIIGGAPINAVFAEQVGATGTARNATDVVELVSSILKR